MSEFLGGHFTCKYRRRFLSRGLAFTEIWDMGNCIADVVFYFSSDDEGRCLDLKCVTDQYEVPLYFCGQRRVTEDFFFYRLRDRVAFPLGVALFDNGLGEIVTHWGYKGGK